MSKRSFRSIDKQLHDKFVLEDTETVATTIPCAYRGNSGPILGRLWLTQNYVGFHSSSPTIKVKELVHFDDMLDLHCDSGDLIMNTSTRGVLEFTGLSSCRSTKNMIAHLKKYRGHVQLNREWVKQSDGDETEGVISSTTIEKSSMEASEAARRALQIAEQTRENAAGTLSKLDIQSEQINRTRQQVQKIDQDLSSSEWLLRGIGSWGGALRNIFTKPKTEGDAPVIRTSGKSDNTTRAIDQGSTSQNAKPEYYYELHPEQRSQHDQQDHDLDAIGNIVGDLKQMASGVSDVLSAQNAALDELDQSVQNTHGRMKKDTRWAKKLTK